MIKERTNIADASLSPVRPDDALNTSGIFKYASPKFRMNRHPGSTLDEMVGAEELNQKRFGSPDHAKVYQLVTRSELRLDFRIRKVQFKQTKEDEFIETHHRISALQLCPRTLDYSRGPCSTKLSIRQVSVVAVGYGWQLIQRGVRDLQNFGSIIDG